MMILLSMIVSKGCNHVRTMAVIQSFLYHERDAAGSVSVVPAAEQSS
jgi:hypothetical protein